MTQAKRRVTHRTRELVDRLVEAAESEENQRRGKFSPQAVFVLEEPIASAKIFGYDVNQYFSDPCFYVEQLLRQKLWRWENFPHDERPLTLELPAWLHYYPEFTFVGLDVTFTCDGVPVIQTDHPLSRDPNLGLLKPVDFKNSGWMPRILRWWDDLQEVSDDRLLLLFDMVWWRGCLDLAIQLRGLENLMIDTVDRPHFVRDLLEFLTEQRIRWYEGFYQHFALPVQPAPVADDWINVPFISPQFFADLVLPCYLELEKYHGKLLSVHSCGNQAPVQRYLLELKSLDVLEVSPWTDLTQTLSNVPPEKRLQVAIHPNDVLLATPEEMERQIHFIADSCEGRDCDINTSGLTPILGSTQAYLDQINIWTRQAKKVLGLRRHPVQERKEEHHLHSL